MSNLLNQINAVENTITKVESINDLFQLEKWQVRAV